MTRATTSLLACGALAALLVSCTAPAQSGLQAASHTPTESAVGPITAAHNPQCASIGPEVVRYLQTGDNAGHPELDTSYAQDLRYILNSPRQAQPGLIRFDANQATAACDKRVDDAAAAQARTHPCTVMVITDVLNARSSPDGNAPVVDTYHKGEVISADRTILNGFRQLAPGRWAAAEYVNPTPGSDCG